MRDSLWNLFAWNKSLGLIQQENLCTYIGLFIVDEIGLREDENGSLNYRDVWEIVGLN